MSLQRHRHEIAIGKRRYSIQFRAPEIRAHSHPCAHTHTTAINLRSMESPFGALVVVAQVSSARIPLCRFIRTVLRAYWCRLRREQSQSLSWVVFVTCAAPPIAVFATRRNGICANEWEIKRELWRISDDDRPSGGLYCGLFACPSLCVCARATFATNFLFGLVGAQYVAVCSDKCYYSQLQVVYSCSRSLSTMTTATQ